MLITVNTIVWLFIDGHVHCESGRIEIEHDGLLLEAEARQSTSDHFVDIVV